MNDLSWIENFEFQKYVAPFAINHDNQYLSNLTERFHSLVDDFRKCDADKEYIKIAEHYTENLIQSVELYY